ncbi:prepilin peptidase [Bacillus sp. KH172YL63]|uniref:prepilin peptidase n=1 Tax=Bacillus sp. KH172YL63 TaxID=2709784 RepID=UPI0013E4878D|nr:A24 family peptidase [Bacillus sp. KH172YL63]BCB05002.1 type 4 prepilin-like proteins leader peptide-processing enzyme [Bacillus sp. KH172YL63]
MVLFILIYGLLLGSFYNVAGLRIPLKKSIVKPRSACPYCHHTLTARELVPVLSYMMQRGKCAQCKGRISPLYPLMELSTGLLFLLSYLKFGAQPELVVALTLVSLFMIITVSDIKYMVIPDKVLLFFSVLFIIERIFIPLDPWWDSLAGAIAGFSLLLLIAIISKGGMGGGDIKLFAVIGFVVGVKLMLLSFFLATLFGAVVGITGLMTGYFKRGEPIAFGPYIVIGTLLAYFFHQPILHWYFSLYS